jgi:hypothetical protein
MLKQHAGHAVVFEMVTLQCHHSEAAHASEHAMMGVYTLGTGTKVAQLWHTYQMQLSTTNLNQFEPLYVVLCNLSKVLANHLLRPDSLNFRGSVICCFLLL